MPSVPMADARRLVAGSIQAQARLAGLWQAYGGLEWWQSGLPAMAANLVVSCGVDASDRQVQALAELLGRAAAPAGWLVWPDQQPLRQQALLGACGFDRSERIWLASLRCADHPLENGLEGRWLRPLATADRLLSSNDATAFSAFLQACHGVPPDLACLVAKAFLNDRPWTLPGVDSRFMLQTFALEHGGQLVATMTAACFDRPVAPDVELSGGLLWLGTLPQWRRRGCGKHLTLEACRWLQQRGVARIHVQASLAAQGLYASVGFRGDGWLELWGCASDPPSP